MSFKWFLAVFIFPFIIGFSLGRIATSFILFQNESGNKSYFPGELKLYNIPSTEELKPLIAKK